MDKNNTCYKSLYENAPIAYQALDKDANLLIVNSKWCEITGYSQNQIIGKPFESIISKDDKLKLSF